MSLTTADGKPCEGIEQGPFEPIAVIDLSADARCPRHRCALGKTFSARRLAFARFPKAVGLDPLTILERRWAGQHTEGFTYAKIGALVSDAEFGLASLAASLAHFPKLTPVNFGRNMASADAIEHAGYDGESNDIDRTRTGVVFANALGGENRNMSNIRVWAHHTESLAKQHGLPDANSQAFTEAILEGTPRVDEDTMPWRIGKRRFGRVANLLDLQGPNHAMDAACASSMAAVLDACRLLQTRQVDVMLAGATDRTMDRPPLRNFPPSGRSRHRTPRPLMHEPTAS